MLGSAGGMIIIPILRYCGVKTNKAHSTCIAIILPICVVSSIIYYINGNIILGNSLLYLPSGLLGAVVGTFILPKIPAFWLRKIFAAFMLYAAFRLMFN